MQWTGDKLKRKFLEFFEKRGHKILPSSSVVPKADPTLLFTNSGMVQFKNIFLGTPAQYPRVCTSQRCIRAGGKHNDLEDVGKDNYHHTFFEMLGNWSFGDYFKAEAIQYAYEFLVEELGLNKDNLYVTIYEEMDKDSRALWRRYLDDSRILAASYKDNFWEMGEFGPCGPCTEIHYDRIGGRDASSLVNMDDPDVIEIWNIVFMEYSRTPEGLFPLEHKNIDTGIGLERLLSILIGANSNYKIDSFSRIISFIEEKTNFKFTDQNSQTDVAFRVLADHSRTMAVCLYDGVAFSNVGVGYVLRRILRRAVRYAHDVLSIPTGVLSRIVECAAETVGLTVDSSVIDGEEALFLKTLKKGLVQFDKIVQSKHKLTGPDVFLLYDTYGFPKDLTELMAREKNIEISLDGFEECQKAAKEMSKGTSNKVYINFDFPRTEDEYKYTNNNISANLMAVISSGSLISYQNIELGQTVTLVFDKTCFYGEKGGQIGDSGRVYFFSEIDAITDTVRNEQTHATSVGTLHNSPNETHCGIFEVEDTQIVNGYVYHIGKLVEGKVSNHAKLSFDESKRQKTRANHSTAHILYYYLRTFLKTEQQGSLVDSEKCRFDFNGPKLTEEELCKLEEDMNAFINSGAVRNVTVLSEEEARSDPSIILENEDYSQGVRIIEFSNKSCDSVNADGNKQIEKPITIKDPCSGTHVETVDEIKMVRIISEGSVKAGIRRIVAITREAAIEADEKARKLKERALNGEIVPIEGQLPLLAKMELREIVKKTQEAMQQAMNKKCGSFVEEIKKRIIEFRVSKVGLEKTTKRLFNCKLESLDGYTPAQMTKMMGSLGKVLVEEKQFGVVCVPHEDAAFVVVYARECGKVKEILCDKFTAFKASKGIITGQVKGEQYPEVLEILTDNIDIVIS